MHDQRPKAQGRFFLCLETQHSPSAADTNRVSAAEVLFFLPITSDQELPMQTTRMKSISCGFSFLLFLLVLGVAGCGGSKKGTVKGKVTFKGKTLPGGEITFHPEKGAAVSGEIGEDGTFEVKDVPVGEAKVSINLTKKRGSIRDMEEKLKVLSGGFPGGGITPPKDAPKDFRKMKDTKAVNPGTEGPDTGPDPEEQKEKMKAQIELLKKLPSAKEFPAKYEKAESSGLSYTIKSGNNDLEEIELK